MIIKKLLLALFLFNALFSNAQDTLKIVAKDSSKLKVKNFIIPVTLITSGLILRDVDLKRDVYEFQQNAIGDRFTFKNDDFIQYMPTTLAVLGSTMNFKSKNSFEQLATNQLVSLTISGIFGRIIKDAVNDKRPELYGLKSFPSGHTSTAFNGATLLFLEYKDDNIWFASSGYLLATTTAFFRLTNDKHWMADVLAGAGIGMATAFVVHYWSPDIYKYFKKYILPNNKETAFFAYPIIDSNNYGMGFNLNFK